mmetsp:Transcript_8495/g.20913  ORF Transcript_8495/g.20913 Transcript_8495/m.20913 type:complete len:269 (+) Transcript_8495:856-1662(+)
MKETVRLKSTMPHAGSQKNNHPASRLRHWTSLLTSCTSLMGVFLSTCRSSTYAPSRFLTRVGIAVTSRLSQAVRSGGTVKASRRSCLSSWNRVCRASMTCPCTSSWAWSTTTVISLLIRMFRRMAAAMSPRKSRTLRTRVARPNRHPPKLDGLKSGSCTISAGIRCACLSLGMARMDAQIHRRSMRNRNPQAGHGYLGSHPHIPMGLGASTSTATSTSTISSSTCCRFSSPQNFLKSRGLLVSGRLSTVTSVGAASAPAGWAALGVSS